MVTALIIAATATVVALAAAAYIVVTGQFPRLAARTARVIELTLWDTEPHRLDSRERSELIARLWVM